MYVLNSELHLTTSNYGIQFLVGSSLNSIRDIGGNWIKNMYISITMGRVLIVWFNNYVLVKSGQIVNPIIAIVPYCSIRVRLCLRIY